LVEKKIVISLFQNLKNTMFNGHLRWCYYIGSIYKNLNTHFGKQRRPLFPISR